MINRAILIRDLLTFNGEIEHISRELQKLSWDYDGVPEKMNARHLACVLDRYIKGDVSASDLESWANLIEGREDIDISNETPSLADYIYELANPELVGVIDQGRALEMLASIEGGA